MRHVPPVQARQARQVHDRFGRLAHVIHVRAVFVVRRRVAAVQRVHAVRVLPTPLDQSIDRVLVRDQIIVGNDDAAVRGEEGRRPARAEAELAAVDRTDFRMAVSKGQVRIVVPHDDLGDLTVPGIGVENGSHVRASLPVPEDDGGG